MRMRCLSRSANDGHQRHQQLEILAPQSNEFNLALACLARAAGVRSRDYSLHASIETVEQLYLNRCCARKLRL